MNHYDERNRRDYEALSTRLSAALVRITNERNPDGSYCHAPKVDDLAKLAECSVATLYTRRGTSPVDPIAGLKEIKRNRVSGKPNQSKTKSIQIRLTNDHLLSLDAHITANKQLKADLTRALDEATRWHNMYLDLTHKKRLVDEQNVRLCEKLALLETQSPQRTELTNSAIAMPSAMKK